MNRQFIHNLTTSFTLWFDHTLLQEGGAFTNVGSRLYPAHDDSLNSYQIYASPYKQWVYDSSISGAQVPSGIYVNGNFTPRGTSGLMIDYQNGRAIFNGGPSNAAASGNYSVKDFNIYRTTRSDEELLFSNSYLMNPKFPVADTGIKSDKIIGPAIFLKLTTLNNEMFTIGGLNETTIRMRATILSDSDYAIDGVGQIFSDARFKNFLLFPTTPLNEFGDTKSGHFSFNDYLTEYFGYGSMPYLAGADYSRLISAGSNTLNPDIKVGFLDFEIKLPRIT